MPVLIMSKLSVSTHVQIILFFLPLHEPILLCFSMDLHQKKKKQEASQEQEHHHPVPCNSADRLLKSTPSDSDHQSHSPSASLPQSERHDVGGLGVVPGEAALGVHPVDLEQLQRHLPRRRRAPALHQQQQPRQPALGRRRRVRRPPVPVPVADRPISP